MDGQLAQITVAQEFIYPTDYQPAQVPGAGGGGVQEEDWVEELVVELLFNLQRLHLTQLLRKMKTPDFAKSALSWR